MLSLDDIEKRRKLAAAVNLHGESGKAVEELTRRDIPKLLTYLRALEKTASMLYESLEWQIKEHRCCAGEAKDALNKYHEIKNQ